MVNWKALDSEFIMNTSTRLPIIIEAAEGNYLYDLDGKKYLDLFTGLGVNILGHRHPNLIKTLQDQTHHFLHVSNYFYNPSAIRLAQRLVSYSLGEGKVFFTNSGAEATESLIKLVHKWSKQQTEPKSGIIVLTNSFHGRTLGAVHLTRQSSVYQDFPQVNLPIYEVPVNHIDTLKDICTHYTPAAILVEPILGSGGVITLTQEYMHAIEEICKKNNILFCIDEIQTGIGRTGQLFAYQNYDVRPDILLFAKAIGGGMPLGGFIAGKKAANLFQPGDHGTTFAPSPPATAMAHTVLDLLLGGVLDRSQEVIQYFWEKLAELKSDFSNVIHRIDGKGMMVGIHTNLSQEQLKLLQLQLLNEGILVDITARTVIRLLPPLTLTTVEIDQFLKTIRNILRTNFMM